MDKNEIKSKLIDMLEELFSDNGVNEVDKDVLEYVDLVEDLGMDSLAFIATVVKIEQLFNISIPDELLSIEEFNTVDKVVKIIATAFKSSTCNE
jgi:acyl carrier protein